MTSGEITTIIVTSITALVGITTAVLQFFTSKKQNEIKTEIGHVKSDVVTVKETMVEVKKQTDGIKTELVDTAGKLGLALGNLKGRAELTKEITQTIPIVIMLDDNIDELELMERHLKKMGIENSVSFTDEDEYLKNLTSNPNVYIIDDKLPKSDGLNIYHETKGRNENSFFIICTGSTLGIADKYINSGIDYVIFKSDDSFEADFEKYVLEGLRKVSLRK